MSNYHSNVSIVEVNGGENSIVEVSEEGVKIVEVQESLTEIVEVLIPGPRGTAGIGFDINSTAKVNRSIVYYDSASGVF